MALECGAITVTDRALDYAQRNGRAIYVWGSGGGGGWTFVHASTDRPWGLTFETIVEQPLHVAIADNIDPLQITVDARHWPRRGLVAVAGPSTGSGMEGPGVTG